MEPVHDLGLLRVIRHPEYFPAEISNFPRILASPKVQEHGLAKLDGGRRAAGMLNMGDKNGGIFIQGGGEGEGTSSLRPRISLQLWVHDTMEKIIRDREPFDNNLLL